MDLNSVTFKEMLRHPYFEYYLVKAIFNYKDRIRTFDSVEPKEGACLTPSRDCSDCKGCILPTLRPMSILRFHFHQENP